MGFQRSPAIAFCAILNNQRSELTMSNVESIEKQILALSADDLALFRQWFAEFDAELWDRQFERDVHSGKLDSLAEKALKHHAEGKTAKL